ncbi:hypothetical protein E2C01_063124 [Portunus trituberculatus]|uniref:Uncharacterized protein n=1 Tax=Portunus trituberculatus TaxID=210409 RepID=A0A5B7HFJ2_PORTR|nr:hypothetical protein [Portunus trituberculatus]
MKTRHGTEGVKDHPPPDHRPHTTHLLVTPTLPPSAHSAPPNSASSPLQESRSKKETVVSGFVVFLWF